MTENCNSKDVKYIPGAFHLRQRGGMELGRESRCSHFRPGRIRVGKRNGSRSLLRTRSPQQSCQPVGARLQDGTPDARLDQHRLLFLPELHRGSGVQDERALRRLLLPLTELQPPDVGCQYVSAGANALSVNCDAVLFGGSLEDISAARSTAGPNVPILASDLVLYPYQMYKLRLAGADAANLIVGALEGKDLLYVAKIGKSSGLQIALTVTSEVQIQRVCELESKNFDLLVLSNRDLETFDFDSTGDQVKNLLDSLAMQKFRERFPDKKVFVEGRVGIIGDDDAGEYIQSLIEKGADGSIVGGALAAINEDDGGKAYQQILDYSLSNK